MLAVMMSALISSLTSIFNSFATFAGVYDARIPEEAVRRTGDSYLPVRAGSLPLRLHKDFPA
jgi:hypothetical protein